MADFSATDETQMLPEKNKRLVVEALDQVLLEANQRAAKDSKEIIFDFARRGLLISNISLGALTEAHIKILDEMSAKLWNEMKRVLDEVHVAPYLEIENDLTALLDTRLTAINGLLRRSIEVNDKTGHNYLQTALAQFDHRNKSVESKYKNEIGIYCAAIEAAKVRNDLERMKPNQPYITAIGENARVNYQSEDNSVTISNCQFDFSKVSQSIEKAAIDDQELKAVLKSKVAEMESCATQKNSFLQKYSEFMALAANHVSALGPTIILLAEFVAKHMK